ncbi:MAG TPA: alpha/beta fold hydrolase [Vicinamibacteria bacterium]|nr:alpha/beta fold hydrolase [Vicinamibacteria bacterium]
MSNTVRRTERERRTGDGATLWIRQWLPESGRKAAVVLVHGLGEHGGRYEQLGAALAQAGYLVVACDLRGHGRSSGRRGDTRFQPALDDLHRLLIETESQQPERPLFLYGHSLGALLVLTLLARRAGAGDGGAPAIAGAIVSAVPLRTPLRAQRGRVLLALWLGRLLPGLRLATGLDPSAISRDPAVVAAYRADPLVHDRGSLALAREALAAADALAGVDSLRVPLLLLHGTADRIALVEGSRELAARLASAVACREYQGGYHEPHNDVDRQQVMGDVIDWLGARAAGRV